MSDQRRDAELLTRLRELISDYDALATFLHDTRAHGPEHPVFHLATQEVDTARREIAGLLRDNANLRDRDEVRRFCLAHGIGVQDLLDANNQERALRQVGHNEPAAPQPAKARDATAEASPASATTPGHPATRAAHTFTRPTLQDKTAPPERTTTSTDTSTDPARPGRLSQNTNPHHGKPPPTRRHR